MPVPTAEEAEVYKSNWKQFEVRVLIRIDTDDFEPTIEEDFDGTELDPNLWFSFNPSWGLLDVAGSTITLGTTSPAISESWFATYPNKWFPKQQDRNWTLQWRMKANSFEPFGTFVQLCSLQQYQPIVKLEINAANGFSIQMPGGVENEVSNLGTDTAFNTFKVEFYAASKEYELFIDVGAGFVSLGVISSVDYRADFLVFGNSQVRQGHVFEWSEIEVDNVAMFGTPELFDIPDWAGPEPLYNNLLYDTEHWAPLPSVISGHIESQKRNEADTLDLTLFNYTHLDKFGPHSEAPNPYAHFHFLNRLIKVESRVHNGHLWTPWRQIFIGSCDEKQIDQDESGDVVVTVRARDWVRKVLASVRTIRAYSDTDPAVDGLIMNMDVGQIVQDLAQNVCGLPYSSIDISATPGNRPQTLNIPGRRAVDVITDLMRGIGMTWWPDWSTGQIIIRPVTDTMGTNLPAYWLRTDEEVERVQWNQQTLDFVSQMEIGISNTDFQDGGFSMGYPVVPIPPRGNIDILDTIVAPSDAQLNGPEIPHRMYMLSIRDLGSVVVTTSCQDWIEHNIEVGLIDNSYLGMRESDGPWVIDGWSHEWEGTTRFSNSIKLVLQHPDRVIRDSMIGQRIT